MTSTNYTQGYSASTTSTHASRTANSDAAFLLPHITRTSAVLDVGCGPGSITLGLAGLCPQGSVTGVDLSESVLNQARAAFSTVSASASATPMAPTNFLQADLLSDSGLPFPDDHFDIVFSSQLFPHLRSLEDKLTALTEMRRVLKPGGVLATRDAAALHFFPTSYNLDELWAGNMAHVLGGFPGGGMPGLYRSAGFEKVVVGAGTTVHSGDEARQWFVEMNLGRLAKGDDYRESWVKAGIEEDAIEETRSAMKAWGEDRDGWYVALQTEMLGWK